jgi:hypothetical protein
MNKFTRRFAAVLTTGALVAGGLALTANAANADSTPGTIKLFTSGSLVGTDATKQITHGSSTSNPMFYGITVNQICPLGYRSSESIQIAQAGIRVAGIGNKGDTITDGVYGTNGTKTADTSIAMDESSTTPGQNGYVDDNVSLEAAAPSLTTGSFEIRYYCNADTDNISFVNDKFFSLTLNFDKSSHTWSTPVPLTATTTSITAVADNTAKTATISTTIKNASDGTTATASTGTATVNETSPTAGSFAPTTVTSGAASYTTAVLAAGSYTFTVTYSGDASYGASTSSSATITISGSKSGATNVTFTVAPGANQGGTTLSGVPSTVDLGTPTYVSASHQLSYSNPTGFSGITVTDYRSIGSGNWSLTASVSDFTSAGNTLSGKYLGWTPALTSGPASVGVYVAPAAAADPTTGGLKTVSTLATAPVVDGSAISILSAALALVIPANTKTGVYTALLTLTLAP